MHYSIGLDGTPYLHTPNMPPYALGPAGDLAQAQRRIDAHMQARIDGTLDWRVDWPDRIVTRVLVEGVYLYRRVLIDQTTGERSKPTFHPFKKDALK